MNLTYLFMLPIGIIAVIITARIAGLVHEIAPFAYPNARIMAKTGRLLKKSSMVSFRNPAPSTISRPCSRKRNM
jgi:hypothetical protein